MPPATSRGPLSRSACRSKSLAIGNGDGRAQGDTAAFRADAEALVRLGAIRECVGDQVLRQQIVGDLLERLWERSGARYFDPAPARLLRAVAEDLLAAALFRE